jgi:hypothetical protein
LGVSGSQTGNTSVNPNHDVVSAGKLKTPVWIEAPLNREELDIYWNVLPWSNNSYPLGWNVYRSVGPRWQGPDVVKLNTTAVTIPMYQDTTVDNRYKQQYYYTVTAIYADGSEYPVASPRTLEAYLGTQRRKKVISMPRVFEEFKRRAYIILDNGAEVLDILVRKRAGTRCDCYSGEYESVGNAVNCTCYGTGFDRGYILLPDIQMRVLDVAEVLKVQPAGLEFSSNPKGWVVDFPVLRNGDIVIRKNGERYEVDRISFRMHQGVLTEQNFDLVSLPEKHPVYQYVVPDSDQASV